MNRQDWLFWATLDMPTQIKDRVRTETLAHLTDADALDHADVTPTLGNPKQVNRELKRLYLTEKEWETVKTTHGTASQFAEWSLVMVPLLLLSVGLLEHRPVWQNQLLWMLLLLLFSTIFTVLTQQLPHIRRLRWRNWAFSLMLFGFMFPTFMEFTRTNAQTTLVFYVTLFAWILWKRVQYDQKLGRTVKLMGDNPASRI